MKNITSFLFILFCYSSLIAQKDDSIVVSNAVLHYNVQGDGQPILLLSGGPGISSNQLSELSERLSKNYKCILFDQRGTGRSHTNPMDSTTINLDQSMKDVNSLLERQNIKTVTIIGHSWGAMLGLSYAINYPDHVQKLVVIGPGPLSLSGNSIIEDNIFSRANKEEKLFMKQAEDSMANHTASKELMRAYSKIFFRFFLFDAMKVDSLAEIIRKSTQNNAMQALMLQDLTRINYNLKPGISMLQMPVLAVCGRQDPVGVFPTFEIKDLNKKATIAWIEKAGHFPWLEQPEAFYPEVLKFLK
jgi:proline iminopeptidase